MRHLTKEPLENVNKAITTCRDVFGLTCIMSPDAVEETIEIMLGILLDIRDEQQKDIDTINWCKALATSGWQGYHNAMAEVSKRRGDSGKKALNYQ